MELKDFNLALFPDWTQPEESLNLSLREVIMAIHQLPFKNKVAIWIDISGCLPEDANLLLMGIMMNLCLEENLDADEIAM
ncbi:MAG: hypothetical protein SFW36_18635, partial [Leptolyngbyaceae cyanobacterium bins.59]|nr:hypothetical protein [Leptolyngbyaceae cyanobacterium bins.59]